MSRWNPGIGYTQQRPSGRNHRGEIRIHQNAVVRMMTQSPESLADLKCDRCGYDLRAHPAEGKCPECETPVAESMRLAAIPRRPEWRKSDPRWRWRMLAGVWILTLLPLMDVLQISGWAAALRVPDISGLESSRTLDEQLIGQFSIYQSIIFCIGVVLLFSKERRRRVNRLDWTRRWGVICSYVVALLSAVSVLFIGALVAIGIAALFLSMPLKYQPAVTQGMVDVARTWLIYGPFPNNAAVVVHTAFSSVAMLLAAVALFEALRSSGPRVAAMILLAPLVLFSLILIVQSGWRLRDMSANGLQELSRYEAYFNPSLFVYFVDRMARGASLIGVDIEMLVETAKWCIIFTIAVWLSVAQLKAWREGSESASS